MVREVVIRVYGDDATALALFKQLEAWRAATDAEFEVVRQRMIPEPRGRGRNRAKGFLRLAFAEDPGPLARNALMARAAEEGISQSSLNRAKLDLAMKSIPQGPGKPTLWGPPGSKREPDVPSL